MGADGVVHRPLRGVWIGVRNAESKTGQVAIARAELWNGDTVAYRFDAATDDVFVPRKAWHTLNELMGKE